MRFMDRVCTPRSRPQSTAKKKPPSLSTGGLPKGYLQRHGSGSEAELRGCGEPSRTAYLLVMSQPWNPCHSAAMKPRREAEVAIGQRPPQSQHFDGLVFLWSPLRRLSTHHHTTSRCPRRSAAISSVRTQARRLRGAHTERLVNQNGDSDVSSTL